MTKRNPFITVSKFIKRADPSAAPIPSVEDQLQSQAFRHMGYYGLAALGVGAGVRGLQGIADLIQRRTNPQKTRYPQAVVTKVPIPVDDDITDQTKQAGLLFDSGGPTKLTDIPWYLPGALAATRRARQRPSQERQQAAEINALNSPASQRGQSNARLTPPQ